MCASGDDEAAAASAGDDLRRRARGHRRGGGAWVRRGEETAGDQLGAVARMCGAARVASAGREPRRLLPTRPQ